MPQMSSLPPKTELWLLHQLSEPEDGKTDLQDAQV